MKKTITDKVISKISSNKINTVRVTREEMADMIDRYFIQKAAVQEDYQAIWKVVKRGLFVDRTLLSKDGNYELRSKYSLALAGSAKRYVWIYDKTENTYYEYNYYPGFYGKFKKMMKRELEQAQTTK